MAKTLLLSCCGPCSCSAIEYLFNKGQGLCVLFYNPNIMPQEEYKRRLEENKKFCQKFNIPFVEIPPDNASWLEAVKGLENEPEWGKRCRKCFEFRLKAAARYAKENGFDSFTSVLGVSRKKNLADVDEAGRRCALLYEIPYDNTNWRKGGLEIRRKDLIDQEKMYKQDYCGCVFSQRNNK